LSFEKSGVNSDVPTAAVKLPKIFGVNWFRKDESGKFIWPGYGDNMRVLKWMFERVMGLQKDGMSHALGVSPRYEDVDWSGLEFTRDRFEHLTTVAAQDWIAEVESQRESLAKFGERIPKALIDYNESLSMRLMAEANATAGLSSGHNDRPSTRIGKSGAHT